MLQKHQVDRLRNTMAHAQMPILRLSAKRTSPFKSAGASVHSITGSRGVRNSGSNAGYTMFRGSNSLYIAERKENQSSLDPAL
jgi:hypothetical protein